ncbi:hypothetical protein [Pengzhenrongella sp.]|jgi:circadian clock protein KaiB|uniref:hypothetical protein n=1 Tax=Pengzhenrongella sp. TaxID=2888820 RepID=UPI002F946C7B
MSAHEPDNTGHPDRADEASQLPYELRPYVAGHSPNSVQAIENLRRVCEEYLSDAKQVLVGLQRRPERGPE